MTPKPDIREAEATDATAVSQLMSDLGYRIAPDAVQRKLSASLSDPGNAVFVADVAGAVVGVVSIHTMPLLHADGCFGTITSLAVAAAHRRRGIASQLLCRAEAFARTGGCVGIGVASAHHRADAHAFYEARGFTRDEKNARFFREMAEAEPRLPADGDDAAAEG